MFIATFPPREEFLVERRASSHPFSSIPYFADLDIQVLDAIAEAAIRRTYQADQVVFLEGGPCAGLYVVESGWLKAVKISAEGREQALRLIGPGEVFNEIGVFANTQNPATVIALEPATVWVIHCDVMCSLLEDHPDIASAVIQNLARRVLHLVSLVEDLSLRTVEARLARNLLEHSDAGTVRREHWATQAQMAARLGTVLDVLNRALHSLANDGLVEVERHQIRILDQRGLRQKAMVEE
jgi:CRP/FNR family transcriptional regulator